MRFQFPFLFIALLVLVLSSGCGDEAEPDDLPADTEPCGGACMPILCINNECLGDSNPNTDRDLEEPDSPEDTEDLETPDLGEDEDSGEEPDIPEDLADSEDLPDAPDIPDGPCENDNQCDDGLICDTEADPNTCRPGCRDHDECGDNERCDDELFLCSPGCSNREDCGAGYICDTVRRICVGSRCRENDECNPLQYCMRVGNRGVCAEGCRLEECPANSYCDEITRECTAGCTRDETCEAGSFCHTPSQTCIEGCRNDEECEGDLVCETLVEGEAPRACLPPRCSDDSTCAEEEYCNLNAQRPVCTLGCRAGEEDNCPQPLACNPENRLCELPTCANDEACPTGSRCVETEEGNRCEVSCEDSNVCADEQRCSEEFQQCTCGKRADCGPGQTCTDGRCQSGCLSNEDCAQGQLCDLTLFACTSACQEDTECNAPQGELCEENLCRPQPCENDDACPDNAFCDDSQNPARCLEGCREGSCPLGEACDLVSRTCVNFCENDDSCPDNAFCDLDNNVCRTGCREDSCPDNAACVPNPDNEGDLRVCRNACTSDNDCTAPEYCERNPDIPDHCLLGCRLNPDNCAEGFQCNNLTRTCEDQNECQEDQDCNSNQICNPDPTGNRCVYGCRNDEACGENQFCDLNANQCSCAHAGECAPGQLCNNELCADPCTDDATCQGAQTCHVPSGQCGSPCTNDESCLLEGDGLTCDGGTCIPQTCENDASCPLNTWCDMTSGDGVCLEGCRADTCPENQLCDAETRTCIDGCLQDTQCPDNQYCNTAQETCVEGCREEPDNCPLEFTCNPDTRACDANINNACLADQECENHEVCETSPQGNFCRPGCRNDAACGEDQRCNPAARLCSCATQQDCGDEQRCAASLCRPLCTQDTDCFEGQSCNTTSGLCGTPCENNEICASESPEFVCTDGTCIPSSCENDEECAGNAWCDPSLQRCFPGCRAGSCPQGELCNEDTRLCEPGCNEDAHCNPNDYCNDGLCAPGCRTEPDNCAGAFFCAPESHTCQLPADCANDEDCTEGTLCNVTEAGSFCEVGCRNDEACSPGQFCNLIENLCSCITSEHCIEGARCEEQRCVASCTTDEDCPENQTCDATSGFCGIACENNVICNALSPEKTCQDARCIPSTCAQDQDCPENSFCAPDNRCYQGCQANTCPLNSFCDLETRVCAPGCTEDNHCEAGKFCADDGTCAPGCRNNEECNNNQECIANGNTQICAALSCNTNEDCPAEHYCGHDLLLNRTSCLPGCRLLGSTCPEGTRCQPETRECTSAFCVADQECAASEICEEATTSACQAGCRDNDACAPGRSCNNGLCSCTEDAHCLSGQQCHEGSCASPCATHNDCPRDNGYLCQEGVCQLDTCSNDATCETNQYCAQETAPARCLEGCREGNCPESTYCNAETRECLPGCVADSNCLTGEYCNLDLNQCAPGCREDDECPGGMSCRDVQGIRQCAPTLCANDTQCTDDFFCGEDPLFGQICLEGCRLDPDNCPSTSTCAPVLRSCMAPPCVSDNECAAGEICQPTDFGVTCIPGCRANDTCGSGQTCNLFNNRCSCASNTDCSSGQACNNANECSTACTSNDACYLADGEFCIDATACGEILCEEDNLEPNNSPDQSTFLPQGLLENLSLCYNATPAEGARDCYQTARPTPGTLTIDLTFDTNQGDLDLVLYNAAQEEIDRSSTGTGTETVSVNAGTDLYIFCVLPVGDPFAASYNLNITYP